MSNSEPQSTSSQELELELVELLYEASLDSRGYARVVDKLSEAFGEAAVVISLGLPGSAPPHCFYHARLDPSFEKTISERAKVEVPWQRVARPEFLNRFLDAADFFTKEQFAQLEYYRECLQSFGIAATPPLGVLVGFGEGPAVAGLGIYRLEPGRDFEARELELGRRVTPHFVRSVAIHHRLVAYRQRRDALAAVIDRLPIGVVMLDDHGRAISTNSAADRILAHRSGLRVEHGAPRAERADEDALLQQLLESTVGRGGEAGETRGGVMSVTRGGDGKALSLMVAPLLPTGVAGAARDPVAALFVTDPEEGPISTADALCALYGLTGAEAELSQLLSQGCSLEESAARRGITVNTARGHLKRIFQKTGTKRQSDLVRLVLTSVARLRST